LITREASPWWLVGWARPVRLRVNRRRKGVVQRETGRGGGRRHGWRRRAGNKVPCEVARGTVGRSHYNVRVPDVGKKSAEATAAPSTVE
jgi:hypothetical protein